MDSIITMPCLSPHGQAVREHELRDAINILTADCPHLVIYLDAGAADALSARDAAKYLRASGVAKIQGFFLNSTHFDWTSHEIRYGDQISRLTGGKHFVVNTGENGQGPLRPRDIVHAGLEVLCNPPGRGLGPLPTANTGYRTSTCSPGPATPESPAAAASPARRRPASTGPPTRRCSYRTPTSTSGRGRVRVGAASAPAEGRVWYGSCRARQSPRSARALPCYA